ncbi:hypothetical protein BV20DRAFT_909339, partial [Pilatotrama ljubarskyi]
IPPSSRRQLDASGAPVPLDEADLQRITAVTSHAWAESTAGTYGSGLLLFHVFCDMRNVPEEQRAPASELLVLSFVAALAGAYSPSAIVNYVNGVRAWHIIHGLDWIVDKFRLEAAISGASHLAPPSSSRKKRLPVTIQLLSSLQSQFNPSVHRDVAIWACLLFAFFSLARLGEVTVPNLHAFDPNIHPSRANLRVETHRDGSQVRVLFLPRTKAAEHGEDISCGRQS